jgi:hypothetical protein
MRTIFGISILILMTSSAFAVPAGWQEIKPGGDTLCARGGEFSFLVHPGDPQKIVLEFGGGGACWDATSCGNAQIFKDSVDDTYAKVENEGGVMNNHDTRNPYLGWTHVVVPYCTGDLHLGNADATYKKVYGNKAPFVIHHRGAVNAKAVVDWIQSKYPVASDISVSGCSAGAYASVIWTAYMAEHYKSARIFQFGDSGAGVANRLFFPQWGMGAVIPSWIPKLDPAQTDWNNINLVQVYQGLAEYYPQIQFSQFNHDHDRVQSLFYALMSGDTKGWRSRMLQNMDQTAALPNFHYFISSGANHCASQKEILYSESSDGTALVDWLTKIVHGEPVENVTCRECSAVR